MEIAEKMELYITLDFASHFVLERRDDDVLPVEAFLARLRQLRPEIEVKSHSLTGCVLRAGQGSIEECEQQIYALLQAQGVGEKDAKLVVELLPAPETVEKSDAPEQTEADDPTLPAGVARWGEGQAEAADAEEDEGKARLRRLVRQTGAANAGEQLAGEGRGEPAAGQIDALIGAQALKALADELAAVAPHILRQKTQSAFAAQTYLFSIGDGCGLNTSLSLLARHIEDLGLYTFEDAKRVEKLARGKTQEEILESLSWGKRTGKLVCIDLSDWMDRLGGGEFRRLLQQMSVLQGGQIFAFRIPFVDEATRQDILKLLSDVFFVREVACPPFSMEELHRYAASLLAGYGMELEPAAWALFDQKIIAEKSDGCFYGLRTVKKIVDEIVYKKHLYDAQTSPGEAGGPIIQSGAMASLVEDADTGDAMGQLDALIGIGPVRERIMEVMAQMELAKASPDMGRPCLHMQFLGGPGTGKTTVARILGRLLKERGLLSKGLFFEYAGRDFCGRYVGETAPKTAAMCRDAYGSVLFIDEAYSLFRGDRESVDFGREAIDTLIAQMENHRDDLLVIMAGYEDDMATLMQANPGLASRIPYSIAFPNYGRESLADIFMAMVEGRFAYEDGFKGAVEEYFGALPDDLIAARDFSNARFVRNLFERTWGKAATRRQLEPEAPFLLMECDFDRAAAEREFTALQKRKLPRLGFV